MVKIIKLFATMALGILFCFLKYDIGAQDKIKTVKIGSQVWMSENLNVDKFRNKDSIPEVKTADEWIKAGKEKKPAWCYYDNKPENGKKYGKLYNWYAVNDKRGLAPKGWHIPTYAELQKLQTAVSSNSNALKAKGQGTGIGVGTNSSGFNVVLAGSRDNKSTFNNLGSNIFFWSTGEFYSSGAYIMFIDDKGSSVKIDTDYKTCGFSVRCLRD